MATTQNTENFCISATSFNSTKDVRYTKPKINKSGGKSVGILNSTTNKQLMLSTPLMLTWGVNKFVDDLTGKVSYDMALQFPSSDYANDQTNAFLENIKSFEERIKQTAVENSKEWLNKTKMSEEVVDALFHPMLKYPKDKNTQESDYTRSPTLKIKLDYYDQEFNCEIYDLQQKLLFPSTTDTNTSPGDLITKGSNVATVIKCGGLWFANGKFGCTWKLEQAVVKPRSSFKGRCLINLSTEDTQRLESQPEPEDEEEEEVSLNLVEDSDVEEQPPVIASVAVTAPPEPVQEVVATQQTSVTKKKVVRRKKEAET